MQIPSEITVRPPDRPCPIPGFRSWAGEYLREARRVGTQERTYPAILPALTVFLAFVFILIQTCAGVHAQGGQGLMSNGDLAVTGFSGTKETGGQIFIDPDKATLKVLDVSSRGEAAGQLIDAPVKFEAPAGKLGQVFGIALDNAPNPNIYATSTSVFGLNIVIPDADGDGIPERIQTGQVGASFMEGQFGTELGGGPGSVYRIDGTTGEVTLFADITNDGVPNSGPGLGNITFDPAHYQFYVSDLDTGLIHRLDLSGNDLGTYDHGVQGRPAAGQGPVGLDPAGRMDITNGAFDSANPGTWGLADPRRRVWGLAYYSGRLYYAVAQGSQIWSVGINDDGSFAGDARIEIEAVPGGKPVSDILFMPQGHMVLAQRGGIVGTAEYTKFHTPGDNRVVRYRRDQDGNWIAEPDEYAIGYPPQHRNASGGIGLSCDGTLWSTGDALRNDPAIAGNGPYVVHGLQGNDIKLVKPFGEPLQASEFIDFDNFFSDPEKAGHVGDVAVYRNCQSGRADSWPGWEPIPEWTPPEGWIPPVWWPREPDLDIEKIAHECVAVPAGVPTFDCKYTIVVMNNGAADFVGHLNVVDNPPAGGLFMPPPDGSIPWTCAQPGGAGTAINCDSDNVETLHPGEVETLEITVRLSDPDDSQPIRNCAVVEDPFDFWPNEDCDDSELPAPDLKIEKIFSNCVPEGANQRCFFFITIEHIGGTPYTGALNFEEHVPAGTLFGGIFGSTTPGWGCVGGPPISCTLPDPPGITMNLGDVEIVGISVIVPPAAAGDMENCVNLGNPVHEDDPGFPGDNEHCEAFTSPAAPPPPPPGDKKASPIKHNCPSGWTKVPSKGLPADHQMMILDGVNPDGTRWGIKCMKPKPQEQSGPSCLPYEKAFTARRLVPERWISRRVTVGKRTIWCARPGLTTPDPVAPECAPGEKQIKHPRLKPKGWTVRSVVSGKRKIYCAKPGIRIPPRPRCEGGKLVMLKTLPPRWRCICPKGKTLVKGVCKQDIPQSTPETKLCPKGWSKVRGNCIPPVICKKGWRKVNGKCLPPLKPPVLCKKGWRLVNGKCLPPLKPPVLCKKGWRLVKGKCIPPQPPARPKVTVCPKNWKLIRGNCVPPKIQINPNLKVKPRTQLQPQNRRPSSAVQLKRSTGKVMMLAPSRRFQ